MLTYEQIINEKDEIVKIIEKNLDTNYASFDSSLLVNGRKISHIMYAFFYKILKNVETKKHYTPDIYYHHLQKYGLLDLCGFMFIYISYKKITDLYRDEYDILMNDKKNKHLLILNRNMSTDLRNKLNNDTYIKSKYNNEKFKLELYKL